MTTEQLVHLLGRMSACTPAIEWLASTDSPEAAYATCPQGDWLFWLASLDSRPEHRGPYGARRLALACRLVRAAADADPEKDYRDAAAAREILDGCEARLLSPSAAPVEVPRSGGWYSWSAMGLQNLISGDDVSFGIYGAVHGTLHRSVGGALTRGLTADMVRAEFSFADLETILLAYAADRGLVVNEGAAPEVSDVN